MQYSPPDFSTSLYQNTVHSLSFVSLKTALEIVETGSSAHPKAFVSSFDESTNRGKNGVGFFLYERPGSPSIFVVRRAKSY